MFLLDKLMMSFILTVLIFDQLLLSASADYCSSSYETCQNGVLIKYPFYTEESSYGGYDSCNSSNICCGIQDLPMTCSDSDPQGRPVMNISNHLYFVQNIDYNDPLSIRLMDEDLDGKDCPRPRRNFSFQSTPSLRYLWKRTFFFNCSRYPRDVFQYIPCLDYHYYNSSSNSTNTKRSFAYANEEIPDGFDWFRNCEETVVVPIGYSQSTNLSVALKSGFEFDVWPTGECDRCQNSGGWCSFNSTSKSIYCSCRWETYGSVCPEGLPIRLKIIIGLCTGLGGVLLILLAVYRKTCLSFLCRWRTRAKSPTNVEVFLENYGYLALQKYKYSLVKKMTNSFNDALGKGAYGSVFKGKLPDGRLVAVKVLNGSKGNGEEFINEVATIGRTNHINVVSLLGFCAEGNKRALIYEFMPKGSLERFIYNDVEVNTPSIPSLGWEKLYEIALGIAKGLEYLHCLCNTRILHFDIKPHNILLDQDFCPKISDFGLAKLCPTRESVISMVGARGTIGYIAPELYCRNLGGVSHKSDVYSYGMMVLEMIGGRKNIDVTVENISEIYFPHWIYNHLNKDIILDGPRNIKTEGPGEIFEDETTKKMIIVALWCIQTHPNERPSISKVVEMLEGNIEELQMPPNPFQDPPTRFPTSTT